MDQYRETSVAVTFVEYHVDINISSIKKILIHRFMGKHLYIFICIHLFIHIFMHTNMYVHTYKYICT
jgi:hypothetical protein